MGVRGCRGKSTAEQQQQQHHHHQQHYQQQQLTRIFDFYFFISANFLFLFFLDLPVIGTLPIHLRGVGMGMRG